VAAIEDVIDRHADRALSAFATAESPAQFR